MHFVLGVVPFIVMLPATVLAMCAVAIYAATVCGALKERPGLWLGWQHLLGVVGGGLLLQVRASLCVRTCSHLTCINGRAVTQNMFEQLWG